MRLGIVLSNAANTSPTHSTVHVAEAALRRGHVVRVFEPWDFELDPGWRLRGRAHVFDAPVESREALATTLSSRTAPRRRVDVDRLDALLLRANPLDTAVLGFAQVALDAGVTVLNDPRAMLTYTNKSWLASIPKVPKPRTLVTRSPSSVELFASESEAGVVIKPARSCGGKGVSVIRRRRRPAIEAAFEEAAREGDGYVVVQEYLPAASEGEKRLLWLDGELIGGYLRLRPPNDFRHNLKVGGQPVACPITEADHAIARALTPHLRVQGIWFAGIDVIGGLVIEVNTLNPGGLHWSSTFAQEPLADRLVASLESRCPSSMSLVSP